MSEDWEDYPTCPYCGHKHYNDFEFEDDSYYCSSCDKEFRLETIVYREFKAHKIEEK